MVKAGARRGRGGKKGGGAGRFLSGPGLVVLGLVLVLGIGYAVQTYLPSKETTAPVSAPVSAPKTEAPAANPPPAQQKPADSKPATPAAPPDSANAMAEARTHINRAGTAQQTMLLKIYYADGLKETDTLVPVEVQVPFSTSQIKLVADQVVNAPEDLKLYTSVPKGTKVQSVNFDAKTGVATVDLSAEAANVQGTAAATNMKASFVYSLTEVANVKAVQLWVNGRPAVLHGMEWAKPISRADIQAQSAFKIDQVVKYATKP
ncbi:MAG TPA: GerMN domain-containing protein [Symbiobacteriaceae bacterium]|nr:GerMN domain-containing protein [Symbiobacteriaceae bacterium]